VPICATWGKRKLFAPRPRRDAPLSPFFFCHQRQILIGKKQVVGLQVASASGDNYTARTSPTNSNNRLQAKFPHSTTRPRIEDEDPRSEGRNRATCPNYLFFIYFDTYCATHVVFLYYLPYVRRERPSGCGHSVVDTA
jgi:ribosomal protein L33